MSDLLDEAFHWLSESGETASAKDIIAKREPLEYVQQSFCKYTSELMFHAGPSRHPSNFAIRRNPLYHRPLPTSNRHYWPVKPSSNLRMKTTPSKLNLVLPTNIPSRNWMTSRHISMNWKHGWRGNQRNKKSWHATMILFFCQRRLRGRGLHYSSRLWGSWRGRFRKSSRQPLALLRRLRLLQRVLVWRSRRALRRRLRQRLRRHLTRSYRLRIIELLLGHKYFSFLWTLKSELNHGWIVFPSSLLPIAYTCEYSQYPLSLSNKILNSRQNVKIAIVTLSAKHCIFYRKIIIFVSWLWFLWRRPYLYFKLLANSFDRIVNAAHGAVAATRWVTLHKNIILKWTRDEIVTIIETKIMIDYGGNIPLCAEIILHSRKCWLFAHKIGSVTGGLLNSSLHVH